MPFKDPEKRKQHNHSYHQEHREEINQRKRERMQTEEGKEKLKQYAIKNKERLAAISKEHFTCGCGGCYTKHNKSTHEKSNMHKEWMSTQPQTQIN